MFLVQFYSFLFYCCRNISSATDRHLRFPRPNKVGTNKKENDVLCWMRWAHKWIYICRNFTLKLTKNTPNIVYFGWLWQIIHNMFRLMSLFISRLWITHYFCPIHRSTKNKKKNKENETNPRTLCGAVLEIQFFSPFSMQEDRLHSTIVWFGHKTEFVMEDQRIVCTTFVPIGIQNLTATAHNQLNETEQFGKFIAQRYLRLVCN